MFSQVQSGQYSLGFKRLQHGAGWCGQRHCCFVKQGAAENSFYSFQGLQLIDQCHGIGVGLGSYPPQSFRSQ